MTPLDGCFLLFLSSVSDSTLEAPTAYIHICTILYSAALPYSKRSSSRRRIETLLIVVIVFYCYAAPIEHLHARTQVQRERRLESASASPVRPFVAA